eukprot:7228710-Pyramimonas_sp.AAC.1
MTRQRWNSRKRTKPVPVRERMHTARSLPKVPTGAIPAPGGRKNGRRWSGPRRPRGRLRRSAARAAASAWSGGTLSFWRIAVS